MRLSVAEPEAINQYVKVYFNGERQQYVQALDTKEGWIYAYVIDETGCVKHKASADNPDLIEPVLEKRYGRVEVRLEED